tara:strand:+ start:97 stop:435 length:339 start_codon:yes stop_codon:yes gene_type:complete
MPENNRLRYVKNAILMGTIVGLQQFIYNEVDRIAGKAFILAPVSLLISFNITDDNIKDYAKTYTTSCILGSFLAIVYDIALSEYKRTRAYLIVVSLWLLITLLYIAYQLTRK